MLPAILQGRHLAWAALRVAEKTLGSHSTSMVGDECQPSRKIDSLLPWLVSSQPKDRGSVSLDISQLKNSCLSHTKLMTAEYTKIYFIAHMISTH